MRTRLLGAAAVIVVLLAIVAFLSSFLWFPGFTPKQSASILMGDGKFGLRALGMCHVWGDWVLEPLRDVSQGFTSLDSHNSLRLSEVLTRNNSPRSIALASELSQRDDLLARLVGVGALAAHGRLSETEFRTGGIVDSVLTREPSTIYEDSAPVQLALIAVKNARSRESVPAILALIETRPLAYPAHAGAARALSAIGDPRAVSVLEEAMRAPDFHALPEAFRALAALHDPQAIPLAIARIEPEMEKEDPFLVEELEAVTGQRFGFDQRRWQEWWETQSQSRTTRRSQMR